MSAAYKKLQERLLKARQSGDREGKAKIAQEVRAMERESARQGKVLTAVHHADRVTVETTDVPTKRSLQEEYIRKFDGQNPANLGGKKPETLQQFHKRRLLGGR